MDVLISAWRPAARRARSHWPLCIVGDGPQRQALEQQVEALNCLMLCHSWVSNRIPARFSDDAIFVLPSRFEGMPNALLEAMAAGLPVVVSDASPGPLEVVRHEDNGLVVEVENVQALAAAMRVLAEDAQCRHRLGESACLSLVIESTCIGLGCGWESNESVTCSGVRSDAKGRI